MNITDIPNEQWQHAYDMLRAHMAALQALPAGPERARALLTEKAAHSAAAALFTALGGVLANNDEERDAAVAQGKAVILSGGTEK